MEPTPFIVATAGHVDHGKSALVRALTGTDPDRLPEEKARGITIDLGYAHLDVPSPAGVKPPAVYRLGIVDVPGHEDFVKNMVAGVGAIDLALLVVACDDGWMPQTEEHLQILLYLGVRRAVVALTKIDLAKSEADAIAAVKGKLAGTVLADAPVVPTSVVDGRGLDALRAALAAALAGVAPRADVGKPRLAVDRAFVLRGVGTVVTGTLIGGSLRRGQAVVAQPGGAAARIRTMQSHNREVERAAPGTRVALNLPDLAVGERPGTPGSVARGDVVTLPELGAPSDALDVVLERSARAADDAPGAAPARPLRDGVPLRLHHGSGSVGARLRLSDGGALPAGGRAFARLRLDAPVMAFAGDHFVLRDSSERLTVAGGTVLDPAAPRRSPRQESRRRFLERMAAADGDAVKAVAAVVAHGGVVRRADLLVRSRYAAAEVADAAAKLTVRGDVVAAGEFLAEKSWWDRLASRASEAVDAGHRAHPERAGLPLSDLRHALGADAADDGLFDALIAGLCGAGFRRAGATVARSTHRPALPPHLQAAGTRIRAALAARPLEPPSRKELAPDGPSGQALRFLLQSGEAVEVGPELVLSAEAFARAAGTVQAHLRQHGGGTVSDLRQALGTSRRIMVPLLEKLDRDGVTLRQGDRRTLRPPR